MIFLHKFRAIITRKSKANWLRLHGQYGSKIFPLDLLVARVFQKSSWYRIVQRCNTAKPDEFIIPMYFHQFDRRFYRRENRGQATVVTSSMMPSAETFAPPLVKVKPREPEAFSDHLRHGWRGSEILILIRDRNSNYSFHQTGWSIASTLACKATEESTFLGLHNAFISFERELHSRLIL